MIPPFDIFAVKNGQSNWLDCAETMAKALELALDQGEGSYFVYSQQTGHRNFYKVSNGTVVQTSDPNLAG